MVDDFINRKHGRTSIIYHHPAMEPILKETYGVIVYQEQVMQIARALAGYSLGGADLLRRAMGKKKKEVMDKEKAKFLDGARVTGVSEKIADEVFDLMAAFAGYGFNKSHSAAYGLVTYQTAYLKRHFPEEFWAALLTCDKDDTDKVARYVAEVRDRDGLVMPPDINQSEMDFSVVKTAVAKKQELRLRGNTPGAAGRRANAAAAAKSARDGEVRTERKAIRFGLSGIKGVGENAVEAILLARTEKGACDSLYGLCERVDTRKVNKKVLEALIKAGALDGVVPTRAAAMAALDGAVERAQKAQRERESGQTSLFSLLGGASPAGGAGQSDFGPPPPYPEIPEWSPRQKLAFEKESLGFYVSGHPMDRYAPDLRRARASTVAQLLGEAESDIPSPSPRERPEVNCGGVVSDFRERPLKSGTGRMCSFRLEDATGGIEVVCFSKPFAEYEEVLKSDEPIVVIGALTCDGDGETQQRKVHMKEAHLLSRLRREKTQKVLIDLPADDLTRERAQNLHKVLTQHHGHVPVALILIKEGNWRCEAQLPTHLRVLPTDELLVALHTLCGEAAVQLR
jgi:DNA polymerase-3 subunit alpha